MQGSKVSWALCFDMRFPAGGMKSYSTETQREAQRERLERLDVMLMFTSRKKAVAMVTDSVTWQRPDHKYGSQHCNRNKCLAREAVCHAPILHSLLAFQGLLHPQYQSLSYIRMSVLKQKHVARADHTDKHHTKHGRSKNALEVHLKENTPSIDFSSVFIIILLFMQLFPRQQNRKDVVSRKVHLLFDLIGCFGQKWHWQAVQLRALSWKVEIILAFMRTKTTIEKDVAQQQEKSAWQAHCATGKQWFCWWCFFNDASQSDRPFK